MKIFECCPFFKENLIAEIHVKEAAQWVDQIHVAEANFTFQYQPKPYHFSLQHPKLVYHPMDVTRAFKPNRRLVPHVTWGTSRSQKRFFRNASWHNEAVQRNLVARAPEIDDEDIIILSDIDEVIDARFADKVVELVKKHGIITVGLHFTLFYFNLFSLQWGGPPNYSYRTFAMTGRVFRKRWKRDSDWLRKMGEAGTLNSEIYCPEEILGFHHSWLGDVDFVSQKLAAYAHAEHQEFNNLTYLEACLREGRSIFPGHVLQGRDDMQLLQSVEAMRATMPELFWKVAPAI